MRHALTITRRTTGFFFPRANPPVEVKCARSHWDKEVMVTNFLRLSVNGAHFANPAALLHHPTSESYPVSAQIGVGWFEAAFRDASGHFRRVSEGSGGS